jgi:hypothetical protein
MAYDYKISSTYSQSNLQANHPTISIHYLLSLTTPFPQTDFHALSEPVPNSAAYCPSATLQGAEPKPTTQLAAYVSAFFRSIISGSRGESDRCGEGSTW